MFIYLLLRLKQLSQRPKFQRFYVLSSKAVTSTRVKARPPVTTGARVDNPLPATRTWITKNTCQPLHQNTYKQSRLNNLMF